MSPRSSLLLAMCLALAVTAVGFRWNTRVAGGADSYGYVSQADLWLQRNLLIEQPWAGEVPWPQGGLSFAPLGYRLRGVRAGNRIVNQERTLVPTYSPGLPMMMAAAKAIAGQRGVMAIAPLMAGVLVLATYGIGRRLGSAGAGLVAAWLSATSPIVLFMAVQPMADLPAAAVWAVAFWCLLSPTTMSAAGAGLAAGLAVLIRPNLVPIAGLMGVWLVARVWIDRRDGWKHAAARAAAFVAGVAPAIAGVAALNAYLHGSPMRSGYEPLEEMFAWANVPGNLHSYVARFIDQQTPVALAGFAAPLAPLLWPAARARAWAISLIGAIIAAVWFQYFAYVPFDAWWYVRFVLPSWPFVMIGVAMALTWPMRHGRRLLGVAGLLAALLIGARGVLVAVDRGVLDLRAAEYKYVAVAKTVQARTEPGDVILSMQHSGTLRYYGRRLTVRWDWLHWRSLDDAVAWFQARGSHPYALLESHEVPLFQARFGPGSERARLAMTPLAEYGTGDSRVMLFDLLPSPTDARTTATIPNSYLTDGFPMPAPPPRITLR